MHSNIGARTNALPHRQNSNNHINFVVVNQQDMLSEGQGGVGESLSFPMQSRISNNNPISVAGLLDSGGLSVMPNAIQSKSPSPFLETTPELEEGMKLDNATQADSKQFFQNYSMHEGHHPVTY